MTKYLLSGVGVLLLGFAVMKQDQTPSRSEPQQFRLTGIVTLDGKELEEGEIVFQSPNGEGCFATEIENGRFSLEVTEGIKKIGITAWKSPGVTPDGAPDVDPQELPEWQYLPAGFNSRTRLSTTVQKGRTELKILLRSNGNFRLES